MQDEKVPQQMGDVLAALAQRRHMQAKGFKPIEQILAQLERWSEPVNNANNGGPTPQCSADFFLHPAHDRMLLRDLASRPQRHHPGRSSRSSTQSRMLTGPKRRRHCDSKR
jgi:hypothetical protein